MLLRVIMIGGVGLLLWWLRPWRLLGRQEMRQPPSPQPPPASPAPPDGSMAAPPPAPPAPPTPLVLPVEAGASTAHALGDTTGLDAPDAMMALAVGEPRRDRAAEPQAQEAAAPDEAAPAEGETAGQGEGEGGAPAESGTGTPDDLLVIEGIGPKVATVMSAAGITTFAQLAETSPEQLTEILREAGIPMLNPATWPEQAHAAAQGRWDDLRELQGRIRNGRIEE